MNAPDVHRVPLPPRLAAAASGDGAEAAFVGRLPDLLRDSSRRWGLVLGAPFNPGGFASWAAPARDPAGRDLVLKLTWRHFEAADEALGLRVWEGRGMVRLIEAHTGPQDAALLLERIRPGQALGEMLDETDQDPIVAGLLRRLWIVPAPAATPLRPLSTLTARWATGARARMRSSPPRDRGLVETGIDLFAALGAEPPGRTVLLATDLHAGNVLSGPGGTWTAIDPKPFVGDPSYDLLQHLLNCPRRLNADPLGLTARVADHCEVDAGRVRRWLFARCCIEAAGQPSWEPLVRRLAALAP